MKAIRRIIRDGSWRCAIVVSLGYLLVLQGLILGKAQGAMAAAAAGSPSVICASDGLVFLDPVTGDSTPKSGMPQSHCATLCQLASSIAPAVLAAETSIACPLGTRTATDFIPQDGVVAPSCSGRIAAARAPPSPM